MEELSITVKFVALLLKSSHRFHSKLSDSSECQKKESLSLFLQWPTVSLNL